MTLTVPVYPAGPGYIARSLTMHLSDEQAVGMHAALSGLRRAGVVLRAGGPVNSLPDVVRWLGEQIAQQVLAPT